MFTIAQDYHGLAVAQKTLDIGDSWKVHCTEFGSNLE